MTTTKRLWDLSGLNAALVVSHMPESFQVHADTDLNKNVCIMLTSSPSALPTKQAFVTQMSLENSFKCSAGHLKQPVPLHICIEGLLV